MSEGQRFTPSESPFSSGNNFIARHEQFYRHRLLAAAERLAREAWCQTVSGNDANRGRQ